MLLRSELRVLPTLLLLGLGPTGCFGCKSDEDAGAGGIVRRIESPAELIGGLEATGRLGDYLLDNGRVRFVVQAPGSATGWGLYGGSLVDLDSVRPGQPGDDRLQELFVHCDLRSFRAERVEIASPGRDGEAGVLRLIGADAGIPFIDAVLAQEPADLEITVEYALAPEAEVLDITIVARDLRRSEVREVACGLIVFPGDTLPLFLPGHGPNPSRAGGRHAWLAAAGHDAAASWVLTRPGGEVNVVLAELGLLPIMADARTLRGGQALTERFRLGVGRRGDVESALATLEERGEAARRAVELQLSAPSEVPLGGAVLTFEDLALREGRRAVTAARADDGGLVLLELPAGRYEVKTAIDGRPVGSFELEVPAGEGALRREHALEGLGLLRVEPLELGLDGEELGPTPARVRLIEGLGRALGDAPVLERYVAPDETFFMPAGSYTAVFSRGPEHELAVAEVVVEPGRTAVVSGRLRRSVERPGFVSLDLHVHGTRSTDSETSRRVRVLGAAAEGLDVLVATDHEAVTDYGPTAKALGLGERLVTVTGTELSMLYGHMNGYPLRTDGVERYWTPPWFVYGEGGLYERMLHPHEVAAAMREAGAEVVQINHPRSSQGVFNYLDLDDETGATRHPWPEAHAVEVLNGKRLGDYEAVMSSVRGIYRAGRRITLVGSSDIHEDIGVGYARTYVASGEAPANLAPVWESLRSGRAVAALGPFVTATLEGGGRSAGMGETLEHGGEITVSMRVEAPTWMSVEAVRLLENGRVVAEREVPAEGPNAERPGLRFEGTFTVTPASDAYYIVEVRGGASPPLLSRTHSLTNPIWVDADGGGVRIP